MFSYRPTALLSKYGVLNEVHNRSSDDQIHTSTLNIDEDGQRLNENSWVKYVVQTKGTNEMINKITGDELMNMNTDQLTEVGN